MEEIKLIGTVNEFSVVVQQNVTTRLFALGMLVIPNPDYIHPDLESVSLNLKPDDDSLWIENWITVRKDAFSDEIMLKRFNASPNLALDRAWEILENELRIHGLLEVSIAINDTASRIAIRKEMIDMACIQWANRGYIPKHNMDSFLCEFGKTHSIYITTHEFKRCLQDAGARGLIVKENRRWVGKNNI